MGGGLEHHIEKFAEHCSTTWDSFTSL